MDTFIVDAATLGHLVAAFAGMSLGWVAGVLTAYYRCKDTSIRNLADLPPKEKARLEKALHDMLYPHTDEASDGQETENEPVAGLD